MKKKITATKKIVILLLAAAIITTGAYFLRGGTAAEEPVSVHREKNVIVYDGPMEKEAIAWVKELYDSSVTRLAINSSGGEINLGMELGEWVFDRGLDVEVRGKAFSSAANYVFTAGKNKYLHRDSMLGWHGGAAQKTDFITKILMFKYISNAQKREKAFFKKIASDPRLATYGQRAEFDKYRDYVGWRYSLRAMDALGIKNIVLIDGKWSPAESYMGKKIFVIEHIEAE